MDELKIEKGIPVPDRGRRKGFYAEMFRKMVPGDSVLLPRAKKQNIYGWVQQYWGSSACAVRVEEGGVRVWRTK